jgi:hypothetical protein
MSKLAILFALLVPTMTITAHSASPNPVAKLGVQELRESFNRNKTSVRFVTLLSPTCRHCQAGQLVVKNLFATHTSTDLRGYLVWLPILSPDTTFAASSRSSLSSDVRLEQGWDADRIIGKQFQTTLKLPGTAWDVYLIYAPGVTWEGETPPQPTFWMHQLRKEEGGNPKLFLNAERLSSELGKQLAKLK